MCILWFPASTHVITDQPCVVRELLVQIRRDTQAKELSEKNVALFEQWINQAEAEYQLKVSRPR